MSGALTIERLGRMAYAPALALQEARHAALIAGRGEETLFLLEHEPVVTLGKNSGEEHVLASRDVLARLGVELQRATRGGDVTYHGPGQLVGYPILRLGAGEQDIKGYVWRLEEILIRTVGDFDITAERRAGKRGIWVGNDKLAAVGVRIASWTTLHGFALNVAVDLSRFELIVPCGLADAGVTSLGKLLGTAPPMALVEERVIVHAAAVLEREPVSAKRVVAKQGEAARRPEWLRVKVENSAAQHEVEHLLGGLGLHTVCEEARCPNIWECWGRERTATFMILGAVCTRNCRYCAVTSGKPPAGPDPSEPVRVAAAVTRLGLRHAVVTSVDRDDLPDYGAGHFATTIGAIRAAAPDCRIEVLIPDLLGDAGALEAVLAARPDVLGHNLETVRGLYRRLRPRGSYARALELLERAHAWRQTSGARMTTKSGLMVGLGESTSELLAAMDDLRAAHCDVLTLGQYLNPTKKHTPIARFYRPEEFAELKQAALARGFLHVESGPLVRSSYHAHEHVPRHASTAAPGHVPVSEPPFAVRLA